MISISDAISTVKKHGKPLLKKTIKKVEKAGGYILFEDIKFCKCSNDAGKS